MRSAVSRVKETGAPHARQPASGSLSKPSEAVALRPIFAKEFEAGAS